MKKGFLSSLPHSFITAREYKNAFFYILHANRERERARERESKKNAEIKRNEGIFIIP
jgi:hypothetical protein